MQATLAVITFGFGAIIGSFLNALLWRMRSGESMVAGRSHCTACGHTLAAHDLVPIASFLALRGRCRYCKEPIHASYLGVEIATAAAFALLADKALAGAGVIDAAGLGRLVMEWFIAAAFVAVFVYDLRYMLIPRGVTAVATAVAFLGGVLLGDPVADLVIGMLVGAGVFYLQYVVSGGKWIGGGDIHVGGLMGAALGWQGTLLALFLAYVSGAAYGVWLLSTKQRTWKSEIPFGTFLSAASLVTMLWGERLISWYARMLG